MTDSPISTAKKVEVQKKLETLLFQIALMEKGHQLVKAEADRLWESAFRSLTKSLDMQLNPALRMSALIAMDTTEHLLMDLEDYIKKYDTDDSNGRYSEITGVSVYVWSRQLWFAGENRRGKELCFIPANQINRMHPIPQFEHPADFANWLIGKTVWTDGTHTKLVGFADLTEYMENTLHDDIYYIGGLGTNNHKKSLFILPNLQKGESDDNTGN